MPLLSTVLTSGRLRLVRGLAHATGNSGNGDSDHSRVLLVGMPIIQVNECERTADTVGTAARMTLQNISEFLSTHRHERLRTGFDFINQRPGSGQQPNEEFRRLDQPGEVERVAVASLKLWQNRCQNAQHIKLAGVRPNSSM